MPVISSVAPALRSASDVGRNLLSLALLGAGLAAAQTPKYPPTQRGSGDDPYHWLEPVIAPEVRGWAASQNAITDAWLAQVPRRAELTALLKQAATYPKVSSPFGAGERLFFYENSGLENQPALYVQDRHDTPPRVLIDPNAFSRDGLLAIVDQSPSPDGRYLAYAVSMQGSSWRGIRVRDVRTGQDLGEELHGIKDSSIAWTKDNRGFFYLRLDSARTPPPGTIAPDGRQRLYYHRAGRAQSDDQLVYENREHPDWRLHADVSDDGQYLVIALRPPADTRNRIYFIDLDNPKRPNLSAPIVKLFDAGDASYEFVSSEGPLFFVRTSRGAPRSRVVAVDINGPDDSHWTTVVRETFDPLIEARRVDDRIVAHRLHDGHSVLELYGLDGASRGIIPLPTTAGTVSGISGRTDTRELYFSYSTFLQPPVVYRFDLDTRATTAFRETRPDTTLITYETTRLYYTSKDGVRVPMFITARRGITLNGTAPTLLQTHGAFGRSLTPSYSPLVSVWLQQGGVYAVPNVRGGGDDGRLWHDAGRGTHKQTGVDDLIAAAEFLVNQRYTRPALLGVMGHGAGGLLAGAAIVQRPELFGAAAIDAGLFDMVRYARFASGWTWASEFGSPDVPHELRALTNLSPLNGVRAGARFPATLLTAGEYDDVIPPFHSYKLAAALQAAQGAPAPILLRVEPEIGHGPGIPLTRQLAIDADRLAFLAGVLRPR